MIKVEMMQTDKGYSVAASGHAGYAPKGQDIVCAAVSVLLQTLANKVEDAARQGLLESSCVQHGESFVVQAKPSGGMNGIMVAAWYDFVEEGLSELAGQYPDHVELYIYDDNDGCDAPEKALNLQKFAEGAAATTAACGGNREELLGPWPAEHECRSRHEVGAGSHNPWGGINLQLFAEGAEGASEGGAAEAAAPAVQEPALRPAQERLARRSGALKGKAAGGEKLPQPPAGGSPLKEGASGSEGDPAEAEKHQEPAKEPKAEKTPEERRRAFGEMVQGEYSDVFQEMMQRAIDKAAENIRQDPKVARLTQALANAYGVDTEDMDGLIEAVEAGRVKDEKYYEDLAQQRGVSVKTARELDKMESDLKRSNTRNAQLQAMQQEAARQQRVSQIQAQWEAQAAQLKTQYPDFELQEVLANEQVADLMRRGVSLPDAYRAAYFDHIMQQATAQTAQKVEQGVAARIQQRASRPGENGTRPGGAVTTHVDVASMSRRQLEDLERRARRGEKITL